MGTQLDTGGTVLRPKVPEILMSLNIGCSCIIHQKDGKAYSVAVLSTSEPHSHTGPPSLFKQVLEP